jgi:hypothetical protein
MATNPQHEGDEDISSRSASACLICIVLLALALRLVRLGTFPYWHDEVHNLVVSEHLREAITTGEFISNHPPLPYILIAAWRAIGLGINEWTMRLLPALAGVATVFVLYMCIARMFNRRTALIAALLLACSPFHVLHSQDLKEYIYLPLVATAMTLFFYRGARDNAWRDWLIYGVLAGVACYTEIFVGPLLIAINAWFIVMWRQHRGRFKGWFLGNALGALMFVPWLGIMLRKVDTTMVKAATWWIPAPSLTGAAFYFKTIAFGYMAAKPFFYVSTILFAMLFLWGAFRGMRRLSRPTLLLLFWFVVPVSLVYLISLYRESIFLIRAMLPYAIAVYGIVAVGLISVSKRTLRGAIVLLIIALDAVGLGYYYLRIYPDLDFPHRPGTHPPRDYDKAAEYVLSHWQEGDVVIHPAASTWMPFYWYGFRDKPHYFCGTSSVFNDTINSGNPRNTSNPQFDGYFPRELQPTVQDKKRVWFVFSEWERKNLYGNPMFAWRWLDAHFCEVEHTYYRGIELFLYETPRADSKPVVIGRDEDDGVSASVLRESGGESHSYLKAIPDSGLVPRTLGERRGLLVLRFDGVLDGPTTSRAQTEKTRSIGFSLENRSDHAIHASIDALPSDGIFEMSSLYESDADSDVWRVVPRFNSAPPPQTHEYSMQTVVAESPGSAAIHGAIELPAGTYTTGVYLAGTPGDAQHLLASNVSLSIGSTEMFSRLPKNDPELFGYKWFRCEPLIVDSNQTSIPVKAEFEGIEESYPKYFGMGTVVFQRNRVVQPDENKRVGTSWPGNVVLEPRVRTSWIVEVDADTACFDVFVFEQGDDGKAYRIFSGKRANSN